MSSRLFSRQRRRRGGKGVGVAFDLKLFLSFKRKAEQANLSIMRAGYSS